MHRSNIDVDCLSARTVAGATELWACSDEMSGFVVGVSTDDGASFTPKFQLDQIDGVLACGAEASTTSCEAQYPAQCTVLHGCAGSDGGEDAGREAGAAAADADAGKSSAVGRSSCGCSAAGGAMEAWLLAVAAAALALARRRRRI